jgi:hypothetical protein
MIELMSDDEDFGDLSSDVLPPHVPFVCGHDRRMLLWSSVRLNA